MEQDPQPAVIELAAAGDRADAGAALDRFLRGVERRALRLAEIAVGDREEALEIVQESMLRLVRRYGTRPEPEWGPLFHTILQSQIRDWYRRQKVRSRWRVWLGRGDGDAPDPLEAVPDPGSPSPDGMLAGQQALAALEGALRRLPLRQQQVFLLRAWEGLDVAQTAKAVGCSAGSVKTHYSRALAALRAQLEGHWP